MAGLTRKYQLFSGIAKFVYACNLELALLIACRILETISLFSSHFPSFLVIYPQYHHHYHHFQG